MEKKIILLLLLASYASDYSIQWGIYDFNTLNPLNNVTLSLNNISDSYTVKTDIAGYAFDEINAGNLSVTASKTGYAPYDAFYNISGNVSAEYFMLPRSHQGIIRIKVVDMTLSEHENCFFFSNSRFVGCYKSNDTILLHTNMNYTWMPVLTKTDLIGSPATLDKYAWYYFGTIIGLVAIVFIIALMLLIILKVIRR
jgi:hypothetical protein